MPLRATILIALLLACGAARGQYAPQYKQCPDGLLCPIPQDYGPQPEQAPQYDAPPVSVSPSQQVLDSVVRVHNGGIAGSGTIIAVQGGHALVVSCNHLFEGQGQGQLSIGFRSGSQSPATLIETDPAEDLSAFDVTIPSALQPVPVAAAQPLPMEVCTSVGYGPGQLAYFNGRYKGPEMAMFGPFKPAIWTGAYAGTTRQGDSGGPMLNAKWELCGTIIGTNSIRHSTIINASLCERLKAFIARVKAKWTPPALADVPPKPNGTTPVPAKPPGDSKIGDIAEAAGGWGLTLLLSSLGLGPIGMGVGMWLGRRGIHKAVDKLEAKIAAKATPDVAPATPNVAPAQPLIIPPVCQWRPQPQPAPQPTPQPTVPFEQAPLQRPAEPLKQQASAALLALQAENERLNAELAKQVQPVMYRQAPIGDNLPAFRQAMVAATDANPHLRSAAKFFEKVYETQQAGVLNHA